MGDTGEDREDEGADSPASDPHAVAPDGKPNPAQRRYLIRGLTQPGGKLPLFDEYGQHMHPALVRACIVHGWAETWFGNPLKPDWLICKLTPKGRAILDEMESGR
jgi:hypothetical protein